MDEKLKSESMRKRARLCYILRAIRAGRCRERRSADYTFIQIYFRMHHFVVKFSKFSSPQAARGIDPPNQNPADALVSRYQKGKTNLHFTEARDSEWQRHQLGHMQVCTSLLTDNHASTPSLCFFTGRMPFLPPNQQRQSTGATENALVVFVVILSVIESLTDLIGTLCLHLLTSQVLVHPKDPSNVCICQPI